MRILIANDKFKGSLSANQVAEAVAAGLPNFCEIDTPNCRRRGGFTATMLKLSEVRVECDTIDALLRPIKSRYAISDNGVMEMATFRLQLISAEDRDILHSSAYGTGLMIRRRRAKGR